MKDRAASQSVASNYSERITRVVFSVARACGVLFVYVPMA